MTFEVHDRERVMTALLTAKPGKREELLQVLGSLLEQSRSEAGCLQALVASSVHDQNIFIVYFNWTDLTALAAHMGSEPFRVLLGASSILSVPAQFRFVADDSPFSTEATNRVRRQGEAAQIGPGPSNLGTPQGAL